MIFRRWPAAVVRDNFLWAKDSGGVWAIWEITPESLDWWKADDLVSHGQRWANGLGILKNEWAIWGACQMITPQQLYEKSIRKEKLPRLDGDSPRCGIAGPLDMEAEGVCRGSDVGTLENRPDRLPLRVDDQDVQDAQGAGRPAGAPRKAGFIQKMP